MSERFHYSSYNCYSYILLQLTVQRWALWKLDWLSYLEEVSQMKIVILLSETEQVKDKNKNVKSTCSNLARSS